MDQLKEDLISIVGFLDWYGQFLPDHTRERLRIMEFISTMQAKENLPHNHELLTEALQMCKIFRDRNQIYHETLFEKARHHFRNYPDSKPDNLKESEVIEMPRNSPA